MEESFLSSSEEISESFDARAYATKAKGEKLTLERAREDYKNDGIWCDVTISIPSSTQESGGPNTDANKEHSIKAHSVILAAYSKYFRAAFSIKFSEGTTKSVRLSPVWKYLDLLTVFEMIYGNSFDLNRENVFDILYLADYLMVDHVVSTCSEFIKTHLTVDQALELWKTAKRAGNPPLIKIAKEFSLRNFSKLAKSPTSGLYDLNAKQLFSIIRQDDLKIRNERLLLDCIYEWALFGESSSANPSLCRFTEPHFCKLIFQGLRLGRLSYKPTCNCRGFSKNRSGNVCKCSIIGEMCPKHRPNFEDYPYIADHVSACGFCSESLKMLTDHQTHQMFPDIGHEYNTKDELISVMWYKPRTSYETVVAIGGWNDNSPTATVQIYNPQADIWKEMQGDENYARAYHGLVELHGSLYCVGGFNGHDRLNTLLLLDSKTLLWTEKSPMAEKRCYVSVVSLNGYIYAIGGHDGTMRLRTVERYDASSNQWTRMPSMNLVRSDACATTKDGKIFVIGGFNGEAVHSAVEVFNPEDQTWTFASSLTSPRSGVRAISCKGKLCVIGGFNGEQRLKTIEVLNEEVGQWEIQAGEMSIARSNFGIEVFGNYIAVFGGYDDEKRQTTGDCEVFCFAEGCWFPIAPMPLNNGCSALAVVTLRKMNAHRDFYEQTTTVDRQHQ